VRSTNGEHGGASGSNTPTAREAATECLGQAVRQNCAIRLAAKTPLESIFSTSNPCQNQRITE
jgi:hypothetical protein